MTSLFQKSCGFIYSLRSLNMVSFKFQIIFIIELIDRQFSKKEDDEKKKKKRKNSNSCSAGGRAPKKKRTRRRGLRTFVRTRN